MNITLEYFILDIYFWFHLAMHFPCYCYHFCGSLSCMYTFSFSFLCIFLAKFQKFQIWYNNSQHQVGFKVTMLFLVFLYSFLNFITAWIWNSKVLNPLSLVLGFNFLGNVKHQHLNTHTHTHTHTHARAHTCTHTYTHPISNIYLYVILIYWM